MCLAPEKTGNRPVHGSSMNLCGLFEGISNSELIRLLGEITTEYQHACMRYGPGRVGG